MNRLNKAINGGDPVDITTTIHEVRIQSIISYLQCHVSQEMDVDILNQLLTRLPVWYEENPRYASDYIKILSQASLINLKVILDHPTFMPPPIADRYINASTPESFQLMIMSSKIGTSSETLAWLLQHNHPDKIISYLSSDKVIVPTPEQVAKLATTYSCHRYSLSLVLADPRFDLSKVDHAFLKKCVETNDTLLLDVLKVRLPDKVNPLLEKKRKSEEMRELYQRRLLLE